MPITVSAEKPQSFSPSSTYKTKKRRRHTSDIVCFTDPQSIEI